MEKILETILSKIDSLRMKRGMSIFRLTELAGLSPNTIYNWYNKGAIPTVIALSSICDILGISLAELFIMDSNEELLLRQNEFLKEFNKISEDHQRIVLEILHEFSKYTKEEPTNEDNSCQS